MFRFKLIFLFLLIFSFTGVSAQSLSEADALFQSRKYEPARDAYANLLKRKPKDSFLNYHYAICAFELKEFDLAEEHFQKAAVKYPLSNFYLGKIYFEQYRFDDAVTALTDYLANFNPTDIQISDAQKLLKKAESGAKFLNRVEDVAIIDSVVVNKSDVIHSIPLNPDLGSLVQSQINPAAGKVTDKIQYKTQRSDRVYFSEPVNGQMDLFTAYKLLDNWSETESIKDLNTRANENYPFLMLDGVTLYFASDGDRSMGGYDIFITRFNSSTNKYLEPENIGMPFNSPYNDYMMIVDDIHRVGWFVSDRYQPTGKVAIYRFIPNVEKKIIRTENRDSLIALAQIKHFTKMTKKEQTTTQSVIPVPKNTPETQIFITDSIVYSDVSQFKSEDARNAYLELQNTISEMNTVKSELDHKRTDYAETTDDILKKSFGSEILLLEEKLRTLEPIINQLTTRMRNSEIKILQNDLDFNK